MILRPGLRRFGRPGLLGAAARTAVVAGTASAVVGAVHRHQDQRAAEAAVSAPYGAAPVAPAPSAAPTPGADDAMGDRITQLAELGRLRDQGVLTADEFEDQKRKLLAG